MRVVFLEDVPGVAHGGDVKEVKNGFARNYLIPKNLALPATHNALQRVIRLTKHADDGRVKRLADMKALAEELDGVQVNVEMRAGPGGQLYGSVTNVTVAEELSKLTEREIDRRTIHMAEPIRELGLFGVNARLHPEVEAQIKVLVYELGTEPILPEEAETGEGDEGEAEGEAAEVGEDTSEMEGEAAEPEDIRAEVGGEEGEAPEASEGASELEGESPETGEDTSEIEDEAPEAEADASEIESDSAEPEDSRAEVDAEESEAAETGEDTAEIEVEAPEAESDASEMEGDSAEPEDNGAEVDAEESEAPETGKDTAEIEGEAPEAEGDASDMEGDSEETDKGRDESQ